MIIRTNSKESHAQAELDQTTGEAVVDLVKVWEGRKAAAVADVPDLDAQQRARLPYVIASVGACILASRFMFCERAPELVNYWAIPERLADGRKDNVVFFTLCRVCAQLPDWSARVEAELIERVEKQRKMPALAQGVVE
jgi:hypothetical protein